MQDVGYVVSKRGLLKCCDDNLNELIQNVFLLYCKLICQLSAIALINILCFNLRKIIL